MSPSHRLLAFGVSSSPRCRRNLLYLVPLSLRLNSSSIAFVFVVRWVLFSTHRFLFTFLFLPSLPFFSFSILFFLSLPFRLFSFLLLFFFLPFFLSFPLFFLFLNLIHTTFSQPIEADTKNASDKLLESQNGPSTWVLRGRWVFVFSFKVQGKFQSSLPLPLFFFFFFDLDWLKKDAFFFFFVQVKLRITRARPFWTRLSNKTEHSSQTTWKKTPQVGRKL